MEGGGDAAGGAGGAPPAATEVTADPLAASGNGASGAAENGAGAAAPGAAGAAGGDGSGAIGGDGGDSGSDDGAGAGGDSDSSDDGGDDSSGSSDDSDDVEDSDDESDELAGEADLEEDEYADEAAGRKRRRRKGKATAARKRTKGKAAGKRGGASRFFEGGAAEDRDDHVRDLGPEEGEDAKEIERHEAATAELMKEGTWKKQIRALESMTAEETNEYYARRAREEKQREKDEKKRMKLAKQLLKEGGDRGKDLPTTSDPRLWLVRCMEGKEDEIVIAMMEKFVVYASEGRPLRIMSVVKGKSPGYLYFEAFTEGDVKEAAAKVMHLRAYNVTPMNPRQMVEVLDITSGIRLIKRGDFVRLKGPKAYAGDLAEVLDLDGSGEKAVVRCVPRFNLTWLRMRKEERKLRGREPTAKPQLWFNADTLKQALIDSGMSEHAANSEFTDNPHNAPRWVEPGDIKFKSRWYRDGFWVREVPVKQLVQDGPARTVEEERQFRVSGETDAAEAAAAASGLSEKEELAARKKAADLLVPGDRVIITDQSELFGLKGTLVSINKLRETVDVRVRDSSLNIDESVEMGLLEVAKYFRPGDHVKVIDGHHKGETGKVLDVSGVPGESARELPSFAWLAAIALDDGGEEIQVFTKGLILSADVSTRDHSLAGFDKFDLVKVQEGTRSIVGVIIHVGRETLRVLVMARGDENVRTVRPQEVVAKLNNQQKHWHDSNFVPVSVGNMVTVTGGKHKGKTGTVKHLNKNWFFLHSQKVRENSGMFVVSFRHTQLAGSKARRVNATQSPMDGDAFSMMHAGGPAGRGRGRGREEDPMMNMSVRLRRGMDKGLIGVVKAVDGDLLSVQLHSNQVTVRVNKEDVVQVGDRHGPNEAFRSFVSVGGNHWGGGATPAVGGATPFVGGRTPGALGAATPGVGGATPAWGGATPAYGGATPAYGGATPAYGGATPGPMGGATPGPEDSVHMYNTGDEEFWTADAATGDDGGERSEFDVLPGAAPGSSSAAVPETPGAAYGQTPGAGYPATPGMGGPQTPGMGLPATPGVGLPATPGVGLTPGGTGPMTPATSFGAGADGGAAGAAAGSMWYIPGACVEIAGSGTGVVKEAAPDGSSVTLSMDGGGEQAVAPSSLTPVAPQVNDRTLIKSGDNAGRIGSLVTIHGDEYLVKMEDDSNLIFVSREEVVKLTGGGAE